MKDVSTILNVRYFKGKGEGGALTKRSIFEVKHLQLLPVYEIKDNEVTLASEKKEWSSYTYKPSLVYNMEEVSKEEYDSLKFEEEGDKNKEIRTKIESKIEAISQNIKPSTDYLEKAHKQNADRVHTISKFLNQTVDNERRSKLSS